MMGMMPGMPNGMYGNMCNGNIYGGYMPGMGGDMYGKMYGGMYNGGYMQPGMYEDLYGGMPGMGNDMYPAMGDSGLYPGMDSYENRKRKKE